jgi:magnesium transporter
MPEASEIIEQDAPAPDPGALRNADDQLNPAFVDKLRALLHAEDQHDVADLVSPLHAADMGDLLEALDAEERLQLVQLLGDKFDFSALTEVDDTVRTELLEELPSADVARGVAELDSDDAVYILEDIDVPEREEILAQLPAFERLSLKRSLDFPEESAGRLMQTDFIAIPPFWTVGQTIDYMRSEPDLPDEFYQIYVVDAGYTVLGTLPLDKFLRAKRNIRIEDLMNRNVITVPAHEDQEEDALEFES